MTLPNISLFCSVAMTFALPLHAQEPAKKSTELNKPTQKIAEQQSHVQTSQVLPFPAEKVWKLIAGFNTFPEALRGNGSSRTSTYSGTLK